MQIRFLGAHQSNTATTRSTSLLVDGVLAIDAGSLATGLSLDEQDRVNSVLITHQHHDHIKDIPAYGLNTLFTGTSRVYCVKETKKAILSHLLNDVLWPNLTKMPSRSRPALEFVVVEPFQPFDVEGYRALAVPSCHPVPTVGYQVERDGRRFFYTGDTSEEGDKVWPHIDPHVLLVEVTYPNRMENVAWDAQHLTPALLRGEMECFRSLKGYLPRTVVMHMNTQFEAEIRREVAQVAGELGIDITVADENMVVEV